MLSLGSARAAFVLYQNARAVSGSTHEIAAHPHTRNVVRLQASDQYPSCAVVQLC